MGMLGAMAGFGQGLQDYSKVLNDKAKMDWEAQQEAVKYERQKDFENLRTANDRETNKLNTEAQFQMKKDWLPIESAELEKRAESGAQAQARWKEIGKDAKTGKIIYQHEAGNYDPKDIVTLSEQELELYRQKKQMDTSEALKLQSSLMGMQESEKKKREADFKESPVYKEADPETKKLFDMSFQSPEALKVYGEIVKAKGKEAMPFEQWRLAMEKGKENYTTLDKASKKVIGDEARTFFQDKNITESKIQEYYGLRQAEIVGSRGGLLSAGAQDTSKLPPKAEAVMNRLESLTGPAQASAVAEAKQKYPEMAAAIDAKFPGTVSTPITSRSLPASGMFEEGSGSTNVNRAVQGMLKSPDLKVTDVIPGYSALDSKLKQRRENYKKE